MGCGRRRSDSGPARTEGLRRSDSRLVGRLRLVLVGKAETLQGGRQLFSPHDTTRRIFVKDGKAEPAFRFPRLPPREQHLLNLDIGLPLEALRDPIHEIRVGDSPKELSLAGHDRRGRPVTYAVVVAPMHGEVNAPDVGAIVIVTAEG